MASSSSFQAKKYDVFISFKGSDVRNGFLSHLHKALKSEGIDTFVDGNLHRGEDISSSLLKTIEQSCLSLVIFSKNYAFSPWCLDELVKILGCKKTMGHTVLPVFYGVDPTHVQHLTGSFGDAISEHRKEDNQNSSSRVVSWCQALKETAQLSGLVSQNIKPDSELIEEIVNHVLENLNNAVPSYICSNDRLVGIESRIDYVESLLHLESFDVRFIGIWGMGGIGKTIIAKQVFDRIGDQFPAKCFVENVREKSGNCANATTSSILNIRGLSRKKVLIVLDDVSDLEQVERLIGKQVNYGLFSRIIVTSRDKQLLRNVGAEIYEVEGLDGREALWLFCLYAFKKSTPQEGYEIISRRAVEYAQGLPLALKVLGSSLYSKSVEEWEDAFESLQDTLDDHIQKILSISYEGLCENDKDIFLDLACFFKGKDRDYAERILGVGSRIGISRLIDKSLISISNDKKIQIHDLIQKMGKDIICQEKQLGKRSRLSYHEDIYYVLMRNKGTEAIKGISLDMSKITDLQLSPEAFEGIDNLRFLNFYDSTNHDHYNIKSKVHLPRALKCLPDALRFLRWDGYPFKSLPISFCAKNIVEIYMPNSKLEELWNGVQDLENLKSIYLNCSKDLARIPNLSRAVNLEELGLSGCSSLVEIPSSVQYLSKLARVDLSFCYSLGSLPTCLHLKSLEILDLSFCSQLRELSKIPCYNRHENYRTEMATSSKLSKLNLFWCSMLQSLADNICNLKCLKYLDISLCENLQRLPEDFGNLSSLEELIAKESGIKELPDSIGNLKCIREIDVKGCVNLRGLPNSFGNLSSLEVLHADRTGLKELPDSISDLQNLRYLNISECLDLVQLPQDLRNLTSLRKLDAVGSSIKYLPLLPSLDSLDVRNCKSLKSASSSFQLVKEQPKITDFRFVNCLNLGQAELNTMIDHVFQRPLTYEEKQLELCVPGSQVAQKMKYQNKTGSSLSLSLTELKRFLDIRGLFFCVVLDPHLLHLPPCAHEDHPPSSRRILLKCDITCGLQHETCIYGRNNYSNLQSRHLFLWFDYFQLHQPFQGELHFSFYLEDDCTNQVCSYAVTGCGLHPVFNDELKDWNDAKLCSLRGNVA